MIMVSTKTPSGWISPTLDRCRDGGGGGDVGRAAHAGLVGERSALDAVEHSRGDPAGEPASHLLQTSAADDLGEGVRQVADVEPMITGASSIGQRHQRQDDLGHLRDATDATEEDGRRQRAKPIVV